MSTITHGIRLIAFVLPVLLLAQCTPTEDMTKPSDTMQLNLDGIWMFRADPKNIGIGERWFTATADRAAWDTARVPGLWDGKGLASYDGFGWYARTFDMPGRSSHKCAVVFEGVDDNAEVWLNGTRLGSHQGHGKRFFFEVTPLLHDKDNLLVVRIEDIGGPGGLMGSVHVQLYDNEDELLSSPYHELNAMASPDWVRDAVVYEVYLRSFSQEGTIKALEARLAELKALGITVVWLMPIHPTGVLHRKGTLGSPYSVRDYYAVNPEFGTVDDMRSLVRTAHELGLHVIIDIVANHTAWDNPLITEHPEWFTHNAKGEIIPPNPDWSDVADLDYSQPGLRAWMIDMLSYWVRDIGLDGFRCDVAEMVPVDFWVEATRALRAIKPVFMLAEGAAAVLHIDAFDMTYAWNTYDLLQPGPRGTISAARLDDALHEEELEYPHGALHLRFTTNHDKHFYDGAPVDRLGAGNAKAAAVLLHMLPGVPLIYNGQEIGARVPMSLFEKQPIDWSTDPAGFRALYTELNKARAEHAVLRRGDFTLMPVPMWPNVVMFTRAYGSERALIAVNFGSGTADITLNDASLRDMTRVLGAGALIAAPMSLSLRLPAQGWFVAVR